MKMWKIIKMICNSSKNHPTVKNLKELKKRYTTIEHNIYGIKNVKKYADTFYNVHYIFKYRIFVPALALLDKFFGHMKVKKIPKGKVNYMVKRFDVAYNKALRDWMKYYLYTGTLNDKSKTLITRKFNVNRAVKMLKSIKEWMLTVVLMDQAYKEFLNILMFNLAKEMQKEFEGKDVNHLIYNSKMINDVNYFSIFDQVQTRTNIGLHRQEEGNIKQPTKEETDKINDIKRNINKPKEIRIEQEIKH